MENYKVPGDHRCMKCGCKIDAATPVRGDHGTPEEGNYSICLYCGQVGIYNKDLSVRPVTDEEMEELKAENPQGYWTIIFAQNTIKKHLKTN